MYVKIVFYEEAIIAHSNHHSYGRAVIRWEWPVDERGLCNAEEMGHRKMAPSPVCLQVAWLILTLRASYRKVKDQVQVAGPTPLPLYPSTPALSPSTSHWPA